MAYKFCLITIFAAMVGVAVASPEAMSFAISKLSPESNGKISKMHIVMSNPSTYEDIQAPEDMDKSEADFARGLTAYVDSWTIDRTVPFSDRFNNMVVAPCQELVGKMAEATAADLEDGKESMSMWGTVLGSEKHCNRVAAEPTLWATLSSRVAEKNGML